MNTTRNTLDGIICIIWLIAFFFGGAYVNGIEQRWEAEAQVTVQAEAGR